MAYKLPTKNCLIWKKNQIKLKWITLHNYFLKPAYKNPYANHITITLIVFVNVTHWKVIELSFCIKIKGRLL